MSSFWRANQANKKRLMSSDASATGYKKRGTSFANKHSRETEDDNESDFDYVQEVQVEDVIEVNSPASLFAPRPQFRPIKTVPKPQFRLTKHRKKEVSFQTQRPPTGARVQAQRNSIGSSSKKSLRSSSNNSPTAVIEIIDVDSDSSSSNLVSPKAAPAAFAARPRFLFEAEDILSRSVDDSVVIVDSVDVDWGASNATANSFTNPSNKSRERTDDRTRLPYKLPDVIVVDGATVDSSRGRRKNKSSALPGRSVAKKPDVIVVDGATVDSSRGRRKNKSSALPGRSVAKKPDVIVVDGATVDSSRGRRKNKSSALPGRSVAKKPDVIVVDGATVDSSRGRRKNKSSALPGRSVAKKPDVIVVDGATVDSSRGRRKNKSSALPGRSVAKKPDVIVVDGATVDSSRGRRKNKSSALPGNTFPLELFVPLEKCRALDVGMWAFIRKWRESGIPSVVEMESLLGMENIVTLLGCHEFYLDFTSNERLAEGDGLISETQDERQQGKSLYNRILRVLGRQYEGQPLTLVGVNQLGQEVFYERNAAEKAMAAVTNCSEEIADTTVILKCGGAMIQMDHLSKLCSPRGWLEIEIVDALAESIGKLHTKDTKVTVHSASIGAVLLHADARAKPNEDVMFELDAMCIIAKSMTASENHDGCHLFPQCNGSHWWLLAVVISTKTIYSFDSMGNGDHRSDAKTLCSFLKIGLFNFTLPDIPSFEGWKYVRSELPDALQQHDGWSCGVFVCHYMEQIMRHGHAALTNYSLLKMHPRGPQELRGYIFSIIMKSGQAIE